MHVVLVPIDLAETVTLLPSAHLSIPDLTKFLEECQDNAGIEKPNLRNIVQQITLLFKLDEATDERLAQYDSKILRNALAAILIDELWGDIANWFEQHADVCGLGHLEDGKLIPMTSDQLTSILYGKEVSYGSRFCLESLLTVIDSYMQDFLSRCESRTLDPSLSWVMKVYEKYKAALENHPSENLRTPQRHLTAGFSTAVMLNLNASEVVIALMSRSIFAKSYGILDFEEMVEPMHTLVQYLATSHLNVTAAMTFAFRGDRGQGFQFSPEAFTLIENELENPAVALKDITMNDFLHRLELITSVRTGCPAIAVSPNVVSALRKIVEKVSSKILWPVYEQSTVSK